MAERVIVDSGGTMNASLLRQGLVDVIDIVVLPGLIGGEGTPSVMDGPQLAVDEWPIRLKLLDSRVEQDVVPLPLPGPWLTRARNCRARVIRTGAAITAMSAHAGRQTAGPDPHH